VADLLLAQSLTSKKIGHAQQKGQLEVEVKLGTNTMAIQTKCPKVTPEGGKANESTVCPYFVV